MRLKLVMMFAVLLGTQVWGACPTPTVGCPTSVATSITVQNQSFGSTSNLSILSGCFATGYYTASPYSVDIAIQYNGSRYVKIIIADSTNTVYSYLGTETSACLNADNTLSPTPLTQKTGSTSTLTDYVKIEETGGAGSGVFTVTIYTGGSTPTTLPSEYLLLTLSLQITPSDTNFSIGGYGLIPLYGNKNINLYLTRNQKGELLWTGCNVYYNIGFSATVSFYVQIIATDTWQDVGSHRSRSTISGTCVVAIQAGYNPTVTTTIPITNGVFTNVALNMTPGNSATTASLSSAGVLSFNS